MSNPFLASLLEDEKQSTFGTKTYEEDRQDFWDNILPTVVKDAYNRSITGMAQSMYTGEQRFDLRNYTPSIVQDLGATAISFLMPVDLAATVIPGVGAANIAQKSLRLGAKSPATRLAKTLRKRGGLDFNTSNKVVDDLFKYGAINSATLGAYDGFYSAAKAGSDEILKQGISLKHLEDKEPEEILSIIGKEGMKGLFKGASLGSISAVARAMRWTGGYGALPLVGKFKGTGAGGFLNEVTAFSVAAPLFDGRLPKGQDFILAGATFGALKTSPKIMEGLSALGSAVRKPVGTRTLSEGPIEYEVLNLDGSKTRRIFETGEEVAELGAKAITDDPMKNIRSMTFQPILSKEFDKARKEIKQKLTVRNEPLFFEDGKGTSQYIEDLGPDLLDKIQETTSLKATMQFPINIPKKGTELKTVRSYEDMKTGKLSLGGLNEIKVADFLKDADGSYTGEIRIKTGVNTYFKLDAENTEKFFMHYSSDPKIQSSFRAQNNKKTVDELHTVALKKLISETDPRDLNIAFANADGFLYGLENPNVSKITKAALSPDFSPEKLSGAEKVVLSNYLLGQKNYNRVFEKLKDIDKKNLSLQLDKQNFFSISKSTDENISPIGAVLNGLKSGKYQLQTPGARKMLRYLDVVDGEITVLQGERLKRFEEIADFDEMANFRQKLKTAAEKNPQTWNNYIRGNQRNKDGSPGFPKYSLYDDLQDKRFYTKINKKIELSKGIDKAFHQKRKEVMDGLTLGDQFIDGKRGLKQIEKLVETKFNNGRLGLLPRTYLEAKEAGIPVAKYERNFFPRRLKRDFLNAIFDNEKRIAEIIIDTPGLGKNAYNNIDSGSLDKPQIDSINNIITSYFQKMRLDIQSKRQAGDMTKSDLLDEGFSKMMIAAQNALPGSSNVDIYNAIRVGSFNNFLKPYASLERRRKTAVQKLSDIDFAELAGTLRTTAEEAQDLTTKALGTVTDALVEKDGLVVLADYFAGASKRQILGGTFGKDGEVLEKLMRTIPSDAALSGRLRLGDTPFFSAPQTERQAIELIRDVITGEVNNNNATKAADVFRKIANLEMITKINLGFATIPNLTQSAISTAVDAGYWRMIRGIHKYATDEKFRKEVKSFTTLQTLVDDLVGVDPGTQTLKQVEARSEGITRQFLSLFHKDNPDKISTLLQVTDKISQFSRVNKMNQIVAGATSQILVQDLRAMAKGKVGSGGFSFLDRVAKEKRIRYAKNRLQALGFNMDEVLKDGFLTSKYGQKEMSRVMNKYARDTQLQRSLEKDNILFNHPDFKPFLLFKRFGYRQALFSADLIKREWLNGNVMPVLGLGAAGYLGLGFVQPAKESISAVLAGDANLTSDITSGQFSEKIAKQFNSRTKRVRWMRDGWSEWDVTPTQFFDGLGSIGAFGMLGDMLSSDSKWATLKFIVTPVFISDLTRIIKSVDTFARATETFYPSLREPFTRGLSQLAPVGGGLFTQIAKRARTPKQQIDAYKQRRKETVELSLDLVETGDSKEAARIVDDYNRSIGLIDPSLYIHLDDFSYWKMYERLARKQKRLEEEYETFEELAFKDII